MQGQDANLTREEAIAIGEAKNWKMWSPEKIVRLQLFETRIFVPFPAFHKALEAVLGMPILDVEIAMNFKAVAAEVLLKLDKPRPTRQEILDLIPEVEKC